MSYSKMFEVRWADLDPNFHMKNTAYGDCATHVRFSFLRDKGFSFAKFRELGLGPVVFSETTEYFREVGPEQKIHVNVKLGGISKDGRKWKLSHQIFKEDETEAARLTMNGAWLDLKTRKLSAPPAELIKILSSLERSHDFIEIE